MHVTDEDLKIYKDAMRIATVSTGKSGGALWLKALRDELPELLRPSKLAIGDSKSSSAFGQRVWRIKNKINMDDESQASAEDSSCNEAGGLSDGSFGYESEDQSEKTQIPPGLTYQSNLRKIESHNTRRV